MAYVSAVSEIQELAATTSVEIPLPAHTTGDLLIVTIGQDSQGASGYTTATAGWSLGRQANQGTGTGANVVSGAWFWKWATSSSEPNPVITQPTSDVCAGFALTIKDAYNTVSGSEWIDVENSNNDTAAPYLATGLTTNHANSLYLIFTHMDGAISSYAPPPLQLLNSRDDGQHGCGGFFTVIPTASTAPDFSMGAAGTADEHVIFKIAVRNATSGKVPAYTSANTATLITPYYGTNIYELGAAAVGNNADFRGIGVNDPTYVFQDDGGVFTDITAAATDDTDADITFPSPSTINDAIYIGYSEPYAGMSIDRAGCTVGTVGAITHEYWNGSAWASLESRQYRDTTTNLTAAVADRQVMGWTIPGNWATTTVNGQSAYWTRWRVATAYTVQPTVSRVYICTKKANEFDAIAAVADTGVIPFHSSLASSPAAAGNVLAGANFNWSTGTFDLSASSRFLLGTYLFGSPRDAFDQGDLRVDGGVFGVFFDSSNNFAAWRLGAFNDGYQFPDSRNVYAVQLNQGTDTTYGTQGTLDTTVMKKQFIGASNSYGACLVNWNMLWWADKLYVSGGSAASPLTFNDLTGLLNGMNMPAYWNGFCYLPIQLGGENQIICDIENFAITFPTVAAAGGTLVHVDEGIYGFVIDARAGDTVRLKGGVIQSGSKIQFNMLATCSASATYDFSGLAVTNANVTLRDVTTFQGMTFTDCTTFTQNGATLTNCAFSGSTITSNNPEEISDSSFTCVDEHAIVITSPGTYNFFGNSFSGYGADGTPSAAIYNNSGGAVTLTLAAGDAAPTVRNGVSATTTIIEAPVAITATVIAGSRVQLFNVTTDTEIDNVIEATTSYSFEVASEATAGDTIRIRVTYIGREPFEAFGVFTAAGIGFVVSQPTDAIYAANGIDGTTVTEFVLDSGNIQIDADDTDGVTTLQRLYAWYSDELTTATGVDILFNAITAQDAANYIVNTAFQIENITSPAVPLRIQGGYIYRADNESIVADTGGTVILESGRVYTISVGSGLSVSEQQTLDKLNQLTEDSGGLRFTTKALETAGGGSAPTAQEVADAVHGDGRALTVGKFLGLK